MAKTSKQKPQTLEEVYQKVFKDVSNILDPNEDYIYRGEDEQFDLPCASSLYRESKEALKGDPENSYEPLEEVITRLSKWNRGRLVEDIRAYYPDTTDNERLAAVQHLGGATNFVDFSEDLNVALFFACYKNPDQNGRVVVMPSPKKDRESTSKKNNPTDLELLKENKTFIPRRTGNDPGYQRARAQKGLVVYCPEGYLKQGKYKKVEIAGRDKLPILGYLRKYHGIDYQTIFYDVHGYIELTKYRHTLLREYVIAFGKMKYEDAEKRVSELINMGGAYWEYNARGTTYAVQGKYAKATSDFNEALELNPEDSEAYDSRGLAYYSQGAHKQAISDYNRALELNPKFSRAYANRGNAYYLLGDHRRAISDYDEAITISPEYSLAYYNRGLAYNELGDHSRAILDYDQAIKFNPKFSEAYTSRGDAYGAMGNNSHAISDYDRAIELNPEDSKAHYGRGLVYSSQGDLNRAISDYSQAIKLNPKYSEAYNNRGSAHILQGDHTQAMADYEQAVEHGPENGEAFFNRGIEYYSRGDHARAISDYDRAIELNPKHIGAYTNRGLAYRSRGEYTQAITDFNQAINLSPKFSEAYYNRGTVHVIQKNYEQAKKDYLKAVELNSKLDTPKYRKPFEKYL